MSNEISILKKKPQHLLCRPTSIVPVERDTHMHTHTCAHTAPQHLVCRVVQSLHTNHMQMSIIEVSICRRQHMDTSMIFICIWLVCRLHTTLHTKCCSTVTCTHTNTHTCAHAHTNTHTHTWSCTLMTDANTRITHDCKHNFYVHMYMK